MLLQSSDYAVSCFFFFFFQAEDGIRDYKVTGVQTCALPISSVSAISCSAWRWEARRSSSRTATAVAIIRCGILRRDKYLSRHKIMDSRFGERDRKSTRLNSSHLVISYAVFCLKKKNNTPEIV